MDRFPARTLAGLAAVLVLAACADSGAATVTTSPIPEASAAASAAPSAAATTPAPATIGQASAPPASRSCGSPTDHVYHAYRLQLIDACMTVTGTIVAVRSEADGDYHVLLQLDPQFRSLLRPANFTGEQGDLVLEPICQHAVTQADAVVPCQGGVPRVPIPPIGTHVYATGAYVYDIAHDGWAELHPLFQVHAG